MTNFDPGGFLVLLTAIPAVVAGVFSVSLAHLTARLGYGDYETNVIVIVGVLLAGWAVAAFVISTAMLYILAVTLSMAGAFAVTRSVTDASYGWVLGVVLLFLAFTVLATAGIYQGVERTGAPQGLVARHLAVSYLVGLFVCGAAGGKAVQILGRRWNR
ncbi:MAG: hypothetical protein ABEH61_00560 [Haloarculaceae archaeon]